ncbi:hypothetical protein GmHk_13G036935 [Glycine max]|nr:hypothetical protein GmHk_13G036935 [Glycine max]KAH1215888.1 hypothetical protein GmHk_13G036935 [Glycine max]
MLSFSQMQSQFQSQMQSQGLVLPPEPKVGPSAACVSTKESCVDPSGNDPDTSDSDKCGLYIEEYPPRLVALGRVYERSTTVHNIPLLHDQVKVGVKEVKDADALIPVPTKEVKVMGQALNTFLAWLTHLGDVGPAKPPDRPDHEVDDPLSNDIDHSIAFSEAIIDFPLYIKYEDLSEIAHDGQCLNISVIQLQVCERGIPMCMDSSSHSLSRDLANRNLNQKLTLRTGCKIKNKIAHWQMVIILPKENVVIWFCSLHNRPDNYLKGIINSALKGLDDTQQSKSKPLTRWIVVKYNRQKGSTECGYYVMY